MRDRQYWQERMINQILMGERSVLEYEKALQDAYDIALIEIRRNIDAFFGKYAIGNKVSYADIRKRLNAIELKEFHALLKKWFAAAVENNLSPAYVEYLKDLGAKVYVTRLEGLETSIRNEIETLKTNQHKDMTELLSINYLAAYCGTQFTTAQGLEVPVHFEQIDKVGIETAIKTRWDKRNYSDSIWNDRDKLIGAIEKILPQSFSRGLRSDKLGEMIAKELGVSKSRGRALARTEVNYLANQADLAVYKSVGIKEYEYLATLDMRTSEVCRSLDGIKVKVTQAEVGVNYPPMHVNCRSTTIPFLEGYDSEERIAKNEEGKNIKVPRRMTQEEWIKKYAPEGERDRLLKFMKKFALKDNS